MANNLYNQLNQTQQNNERPTVQSIIQEVQQSGMTAQELFFKKVQELNINPMDIINQIPNQFR